MEQTSNVEAGTESENTAIPGDWADVYAYADDGEFATVWCVRRTSDYEIAVTAFRFEAGSASRDGNFGKKYFEVDPDVATETWAKDYAENHKTSVRVAKEYHS